MSAWREGPCELDLGEREGSEPEAGRRHPSGEARLIQGGDEITRDVVSVRSSRVELLYQEGAVDGQDLPRSSVPAWASSWAHELDYSTKDLVGQHLRADGDSPTACAAAT
jgi:hypothetical protein